MSGLVMGLGALVGVMILGIFGFMVRDVFANRGGSGIILVMGLIGLFVGERVLGVTDYRLVVSGIGIAVVLGALGLRAYAWSTSPEGARKQGHRQALIWTSVVVASLFLYALTLAPITGALGVEDEAAKRWSNVWTSLFPIVTLIGLIPVFMLDRLLTLHPIQMPAGVARKAQLAGVSSALAISLMFPINYLVKANDVDRDVAYFRTTQPGESTLALVGSLTDPVEAVLFYPAGNEVGQQIRPYFEGLSAASGGLFTYTVVDQAIDPVRAEEHKVRNNGQIVLVQGESRETFKLTPEIERAKRDLRKFDGTVQKHLIKLTRGQRVLYFLVGHGEANWRERDNPLRKINILKKDVFEGQNFKVKTLGVSDGSTDRVPDDATVVVVAAPTEPPLPEEIDALMAFYDGGGTLMVLLDSESDPLTDLLARLGLQAGTAPLASLQHHARLTGGKSDVTFIATNKYGSHPSVKTLSRAAANAPMVLPNAVWVKKAEGTEVEGKVTALIRTQPTTFEDVDRDFEMDEDEKPSVHEVGVAVTKPVTGDDGEAAEARAIVIGNLAFVSDPIASSLKTGPQLAFDGARWLSHDEEIVGEVETEEDVKIQHTRDEDWLWFLLAIVLVPGLVLGFGVVFNRMRRR